MCISLIKAQNVNIPDAKFKAALVNNPSINTNGDGEIQLTEAAAYNGYMNVSFLGIADLTGLEAFTALNVLICVSNLLTSLDVSANTALYYLDCSHNSITSLDVSAITGLEYLDCTFNSLTSLNVSTNTAVTKIFCEQNNLMSLNVSGCTNLSWLVCNFNSLTSLNLSANTALTWLECGSNQLTSLNVQNGNNKNLTIFYANINPKLTCIQVDNVAYSNGNWSSGKDAGASFSTKCGGTYVSDIGNLANVRIFPNPAFNHLTIDLGSNNQKVEVTITDITGKIIYAIPKVIGTSETQKIEVNTKDFAEGMYVVQIQSEEFIETKKFIVKK